MKVKITKFANAAAILAVFFIPLVGAILGANYLIHGQGTIFEITLGVVYGYLGILSITLVAHRYGAHESYIFKNKTLEKVLCVIFCGVWQGKLAELWIPAHKDHHTYSDEPRSKDRMKGDFHTPYQNPERPILSFIEAHFTWVLSASETIELRRRNDPVAAKRYVVEDPIILWSDRTHWYWAILSLALPFILGCIEGVFNGQSAQGILWTGVRCFVIAGLLRVFVVNQVTYLVNSLGHVDSGEQHFFTGDFSQNPVRSLKLDIRNPLNWLLFLVRCIWIVIGWILSILTGGEWLHNGHHGFQMSAKFAHLSWQIDVGFGVLCFFEERDWIAIKWDKIPSKTVVESRLTTAPAKIAKFRQERTSAWKKERVARQAERAAGKKVAS